MVIFFAVTIPVLYFVRHNTCRSYIEIWGGLLPVQVRFHLPGCYAHTLLCVCQNCGSLKL